MSVLTPITTEELNQDDLEILVEVFSDSDFFLCSECETESFLDQMKFCSSCSRQLCPDCFFSDFDSICYDCQISHDED